MKTSKYWGVSFAFKNNGAKCQIVVLEKKPWVCSVLTPNGEVRKRFANEREAAIHADRINLEYKLGKPLNILKPMP